MPGVGEVTQEQFQDLFSELLSGVGGYTLVAKTRRGREPVGLVIIGGEPSEYRITPVVIWFPWASPRNKLEASVQFVQEVRKTRLVMVWSPEPDTPFFTHLCRYGVMRRGCKVQEYFDQRHDAMLFYSRSV